MSLWLVRAGKTGENEQIALDSGIVTIGWNRLPDLSSVETREQLSELFRESFPDASSGRIANQVGQLWAFRTRIEVGDLVALPLETQAAIAIGKIAGPYEYRTDLGDSVRHARRVNWIRTDIPRTSFDQDLLYSLGAFMTVCQIKRNDAEGRVRAMLAGKKLPPSIATNGEDVDDADQELDIEQAARDQIVQYIQQNFVGHDLARLVDAVLQAEGFLTRVSPAGADGGVDILAGAGAMGFDAPRLCVQVKSSQSPADVTMSRSFGSCRGFSRHFRPSRACSFAGEVSRQAFSMKPSRAFSQFDSGIQPTCCRRCFETTTNYRTSCKLSCRLREFGR